MADVITKLKLETTQFDSKLRDSAQSLTDLTHHLSLAGKDFDRFAQKHIEAAKAFGETASGATNLKDKLKDLVGAYNKVANAYNALTEDQKKTDFGKAMAESLNKLQGQIRETKNELNAVPGLFDQLTSKLTVNIDAMKLFEVGLKAGSAALGVAKDAFFANEATVDEWGRTVAASQSLYEGFLTALNTGDISGYLNNINQIVAAAREAYNELDTLQTMQTIQAPAKSAKETEIQRMRMMLMTGKYIAPSDGRAAAMFNGRRMQTGDTLTPGQLRGIEKQITNATKDIVTITEREVKQAGKHIDAYYNKLAKENGIALADFRKGTSSWDEFTKRVRGAEEYRKFESEHTYTRQAYNAQIGEYETQYYRDNVANPYTQYRGWDVFRVDKMGENSYNDLVGYIKQRDQQSNQLYSLLGQTFRTTNRLEGITPRNLLKGAGGSGNGGNGPAAKEVTSMLKIDELGNITISTTESMKQLQTQLRDYQQKLSTATNAFDQYSAQQGIEQTQKKIDAQPMALSLGWDTERAAELQEQFTTQFSNLLEEMRSKIEEVEVEGDSTKSKRGGGMTKFDEGFGKAQKAMGGLTQIASGIEQMGIKLPDEIHKVLNVLQGLMSVIQGVQTIISIFQTSALTANTVAVNLNTAAILTKGFIPFFANGGVVPHAANGFTVPGTHFSGDTTPILANAGEVVLNRAQVGNLASQLQDNNGGDGQMRETYVRGETIYLALTNYMRRSGKSFKSWQ